DISRTLGVGRGTIALAVAVKTIAIAIAPLPMAAVAQRFGRRGFLCVAAAVAWSLTGISTGLVVSAAGLMIVLGVDGLTTGSIEALHTPLLLDVYPPAARVRSITYYRAAMSAGNVIAPLGVAVVGVLLVPFQTFLFFFLRERWAMGAGQRGLFFALLAASGMAALALFGRRAESMFQVEPGRLVTVAGRVLMLAVVVTSAAALVPSFAVM